MSVFCDGTERTLQKEFDILKDLERQTISSKGHASLPRKNSSRENKRNFSAHPKHLVSDSEASPGTSPRGDKIPCSLSDMELSMSCLGHHPFKERKEKTQTIHKKLHEKLSLINRNHSDSRSELSEIGDGYLVQSKTLEERLKRVIHSDSSDGSSIDLRVDSPPSKNYKNNQKGTVNISTVSVLSKRTNSRFSTGQNSLASRGIPSSVFEKKYKMICEKALQNINDIRTILNKGKPTSDGEEDMNRRETRVKEFSSRFSRNYLYPMVRQLQDLNQPSQPLPIVNQKMLSAYQYVHHGLQAYQSHLPTSTGDCCGHQFRAMMVGLVDLCEIHRKRVGDGEEEYVLEFIDTFKINAELAIQKINEFLTTNIPKEAKSENFDILRNQQSDKKQNGSGKMVNRKNFADKRFAMYSKTAAFRKDVNWKKAVESLAKKKFNVKSKYRTASYKHRPPVQKEPPALCLPKFPFYGPSKKSGLLKNSPVGHRLNEDQITTMVEVEENGGKYEAQNNESEGGNKKELLVKLLQWTLKNRQEEAKKTDLNEILDLVKQEDSADFFKKVLEGLQDGAQNDGETEIKDGDGQQLTLEIVKSQTSLPSEDESRPKSQRKPPKIVVSGEKNARLICITDENSIIGPCSDDENDKIETKNINCQTEQPKPEPKPKIVIRTSSETQTDVRTHDVTEAVTKSTQKGRNQTSVKISRLKKTGRPLRQLQKKYAVNIIQYKLDFYRHCKDDPMYKRTNNCQPCILMGKISEDILNESLLGVAREIEINDIAERVYKAELSL